MRPKLWGESFRRLSWSFPDSRWILGSHVDPGRHWGVSTQLTPFSAPMTKSKGALFKQTNPVPVSEFSEAMLTGGNDMEAGQGGQLQTEFWKAKGS